MKKIMLFFVVACIMTACNNDNEVLNEPQYITEFKADFSADTRMTVNPSAAGLKFTWENGDYLYVFQADDPTVYQKRYEYDAATQTFKLSTGGFTAMEAGKKYFATNGVFSSAGNAFTIEGDEIRFNAKLYYSTGYDIADIPLISDVFDAKLDGTIAPMHHTVGLVEVPVKLDAESSSTTLKNLGFSQSAGTFIATPEFPYFKEITDGTYSSWANMGDKELSTTTATSIFIPMLPGTYVNPYLNYKYGNRSSQKSLTGTLTVERGKVTKLPEQTLKLQ